MAEIGKVNKLTVISTQDEEVLFGGHEFGNIHLAERFVSGKFKVGGEVQVFVYIDREGELRAITGKPYATVGQFAKLRVVANSSAGAFLSWGMKDDLLVPKSEQLAPMTEGQSYVVYVFLSHKTNRITASSKLDKFLGKDEHEYIEGDEVDLIIFDKSDLGYRAVIDQSHVGMIYENEVFQKLSIGQELKGYIYHVREDDKIDLRLQQSGYAQVDDISQAILDVLQENGGGVSLSDKSPPEEIYAQFGVSKKVFKKAIGALYKKRIITISRDGIRLVA